MRFKTVFLLVIWLLAGCTSGRQVSIPTAPASLIRTASLTPAVTATPTSSLPTVLPPAVLPSPTPYTVTAVRLPPESSQPAPDLPFVFEPVGQLGGQIKAVVVADGLAYLALGLTLMVLDISDPAGPTPVAETLLPDPAEDLYLIADTLYVLTRSQATNLLTFDLSAPANPDYRAGLRLTASETPVRIVGYTAVPPRLYLSGPGDGLQLVDISRPQQPAAAGAIQLEERPTGAAVRADPGGPIYVYLGQTGSCRPASRGYRCDGRLRVLDISDPTAPGQVGILDTPAPPIKFAISHDRAYLVEQHCDMDAGCHGGLEMVALSDPARPRSLGFVEAWSRSLAVDDRLAVADNLQVWSLTNPSPQPLTAGKFEGQIAALVDNKAFLFTQAELQIIDISDPAAPRDLGRFRSPGPVNPASLAVAGQYLYVADFAYGLRAIDLTNPAAPREVGVFTDDARQETYPQIQWAGAGRLYLTDDTATTLQIIDTGDPTRPGAAGRYAPSGGQVKAAGNTAYAGTHSGLQIIDLADPAAPIEVGFYDLPNAATAGVWPLDGYVYLTMWDQGLQAVDLSASGPPAPLGFYRLPAASDLAVVEGYGYYTVSGEGLQIVDLTDPARPVAAGFLSLPGVARLSTVANGVAYLLDEEGHLRLADVSDPAAPVEQGSYRGASFPGQILVDFDRPVAYLLHAGRGLVSLDLSDPGAPVELSVLALPPNMSRAGGSLIGRRLYVYGEFGYLGGHPVLALDVSNPAAPVELGTSTPPGALRKIAPATCAAQQDGVAYAYLQNLDNELVIADLSDPANPLELGRYRPATIVHFVKAFVANCLVYLLDDRGAIWVVDVSDPGRPQLAAHHTRFSTNSDLLAVNDYAYLSAPQMTLRVVDVSNPAHPQEVRVTGLGRGWVERFEPTGDRAYLVQNQPGGSWLKTLDISDRTDPTVLGAVALSETTEGELHAARGQYVYLIDRERNLVMLDLSDPNQPVEAGRYDAPGPLGRMTLGQDDVIVAGRAGLQVLRLVPN